MFENLKSLRKHTHGAGFLVAVILLIAVMMSTIISAIIFFAFVDGVTVTSTDATNTTNTVKGYAITVFGLLAIVPFIMVGGLMLRSLGFMGGAGAEF